MTLNPCFWSFSTIFKRLDIFVTRQSNKTIITIKDNGIGRNAAAKLKTGNRQRTAFDKRHDQAIPKNTKENHRALLYRPV